MTTLAKPLVGKVALVTGAGGTMGSAVVEALIDDGCRVALIDIAAASMLALERKYGPAVHAVVCDIADPVAVARAHADIVRALGDVDILVNNAGATWGALAEDYPVEGWDKVMNVNIRGLFLLTRNIGKASMIPRRCGRVINISSVAALGGNVDQMQAVAYNTSKGAVKTFTRALAAEWGRYGITVNAIAPGVFPSKMGDHLVTHTGDGPVPGVPLGRYGDNEDLKGATLLFASDAGKHITGQFLPVDGGASAVILA